MDDKNIAKSCKNVALSEHTNGYVCLEADMTRAIAFLVANMAPVLRVTKKVIF